MIIPLGRPLPTASSDRTRRLQASNLSPTSTHPAWVNRRRERLPIWSCTGWGLPNPDVATGIGALLPHRFTLTKAPCTLASHSVRGPGGLFSVALSLGSPPLEVIQHPALWSPDFPPPAFRRRAIIWPSSSWKPALPSIRHPAATGHGTGWRRLVARVGILQLEVQGREIDNGTCNPTAVAESGSARYPAHTVKRGKVAGLQVRTKAKEARQGLA